MATQNPIPTTRCAQCNQPANQVCKGCADTPDIDKKATIGKTYYCNSDCQRLNWSTHKSTCKRLQNRKALYRAGAILQEIFYVYREKLFDRPVDRIEVTGSLRQRNMRMEIYKNEWPHIVTNYDYIQPFLLSICKSLEEM
jgi:hypothetical protein